jgi:hypothetical protein
VVKGVIVNSIHSLGSQELAELRKGYPGFDESVWILEEGRSFPSPGVVTMFYVGGGALAAIAAAAGVLWLIMRLRAT